MEKILIIQNKANQIVNFNIESISFTLRIYLRNNIFYADLYQDKNEVILGVPLIQNTPINIYPQQVLNGYLYTIISDNSDVVTLDNIGVTANIFYSKEKINA